MAMTGNGLSQAICAALGITDPKAVAEYTKMCTAIVTYIQSNAVVNTADSGTIVGVAATGTGPAPVTGTCSGTGTGTVS